MPRNRRVAIAVLAVLLTLTLKTPLDAGDWPQILGPHRDGVAEDEKLAERWPVGGPRTLWRKAVGDGYAGVAVQGQTGVLFHRQKDQEVIAAFDPQTAEVRWENDYKTSFKSQVGGNDGPLCVPTIVGDRVITFGAQGVLTCCELEGGRQLWQRDTQQDFGSRDGYFGVGSSPVVDGERVIVNVGGFRKESGIVAFDLKSGKTIWQATSEQPSYASPIVTSLDGRRVAIVITRAKCVGITTDTGDVLFELRFGQRGPTVNGACPLLVDGQLFLTASYGVGALLAKISATGADELWRRDDVCSSQYTTCIEHDSLLYGIDGREDIPPANLVCFDPKTRKVHWTQPSFGYATLIKADGKLLAAGTDGSLVMFRPNADEYEELGRAQVFKDEMRALPALAGNRLFLRDDTTLKCLVVPPRK